jgi:uncharacterized protein YndB with AHSA1/START domain
MTNTDRIEKKVILRAKPSRVFSALSDSSQFGTWFRAKLDGPFVQGKSVHGRVTYPGYEHLVFEMAIARVEPDRYFAYRWHPYPNDPKMDYSKEPMTLVEFSLEEAKEGTLLTIVESGFDQLPVSRRDEAFRMNDGGWTGQIENITEYLATP